MNHLLKIQEKLSCISLITTDHFNIPLTHAFQLSPAHLLNLSTWMNKSDTHLYEQALNCGEKKVFLLNVLGQIYFIYSDKCLSKELLKKEIECLNLSLDLLPTRSIKRKINTALQTKKKSAQGKWIMDKIQPDTQCLSSFFKKHYALVFNKEEVGGDFIWVDSNDSDVCFALVDCNGHGVEGAMTALIFHNIIKNVIKLNQSVDLVSAVHEIQQEVDKYNHKCESSSDVLSAEISLNIFNKNTKLLKTCTVGITTLIDHERCVNIVKSKNRLARKPIFKEFFLSDGDKVMMFSDGLTDQFSSNTGKRIGTRRLINMFKDNHLTNKDKLLDFYNNWKGNELQTDDVSVLGVEV